MSDLEKKLVAFEKRLAKLEFGLDRTMVQLSKMDQIDYNPVEFAKLVEFVRTIGSVVARKNAIIDWESLASLHSLPAEAAAVHLAFKLADCLTVLNDAKNPAARLIGESIVMILAKKAGMDEKEGDYFV